MFKTLATGRATTVAANALLRRQAAALAPARRELLVCRWQISPVTGKPACSWRIDRNQDTAAASARTDGSAALSAAAIGLRAAA